MTNLESVMLMLALPAVSSKAIFEIKDVAKFFVMLCFELERGDWMKVVVCLAGSRVFA
jgi:hypothetical protein